MIHRLGTVNSKSIFVLPGFLRLWKLVVEDIELQKG